MGDEEAYTRHCWVHRLAGPREKHVEWGEESREWIKRQEKVTCAKARGKSTHYIWHPPIGPCGWIQGGKGGWGVGDWYYRHWSSKLRKVSLHKEVTQWSVWRGQDWRSWDILEVSHIHPGKEKRKLESKHYPCRWRQGGRGDFQECKVSKAWETNYGWSEGPGRARLSYFLETWQVPVLFTQ